VKSQTSITVQTIAALSEHGRLVQSFIGDRVPYAMAMTSGQTAPEIDSKSPASKETKVVWLNIKSCFNENSK
jgi:chromosome partitioning protein